VWPQPCYQGPPLQRPKPAGRPRARARPCPCSQPHLVPKRAQNHVGLLWQEQDATGLAARVAQARQAVAEDGAAACLEVGRVRKWRGSRGSHRLTGRSRQLCMRFATTVGCHHTEGPRAALWSAARPRGARHPTRTHPRPPARAPPERAAPRSCRRPRAPRSRETPRRGPEVGARGGWGGRLRRLALGAVPWESKPLLRCRDSGRGRGSAAPALLLLPTCDCLSAPPQPRTATRAPAPSPAHLEV
jgi:hypothetical protein